MIMSNLPKIEDIEDVECYHCGHYTEEGPDGFGVYSIHSSSVLKRLVDGSENEYYIVLCDYCASFHNVGYPLYASFDSLSRDLAMGFHVLEKRLLEKLNK